MKFFATLFAVSALFLAALCSFPAIADAGGHGVQVQAFAAPSCHAGVQAFAVPAYQVQTFAVQAAPVYGFQQQAFAVKSFGVRQQAAFVPQVNVQVNQQQRRGFFSRFNRGTNVRVNVR